MALTINEMIYKTINTKLKKEPKYKEILEQLGYTVFDSGYSDYDCWSVKNNETEKMVCFSKGYSTNKKMLFNWGSPIKTYDFKKVDFANFLKRKRNHLDRCVSTSHYEVLRRKISYSKRSIKWYNDDIAEVQKKIGKLKEDLDRYNKYIEENEQKLEDARDEVFKLKNNK